MDDQAISQQVLIEHEMLMHLISALRTILSWTTHGHGMSRKLSSLRFMAQSLERHLERLMALEEHDGYMEVVVQARPELSKEIEALRGEHDEFRRAMHRLTSRLERLAPDDTEQLESISNDLDALLDKLDRHSTRETDLLQRSLLQEDGGSG